MKGDGIDVLGDRNCRTAAVDLSLRLSYGVREAAGGALTTERVGVRFRRVVETLGSCHGGQRVGIEKLR